MTKAVELNNITMQYPGTSFLANDDVSINVEKGSVLCLVGENGAGKSTLMNILYGLHKQTSGTIKIFGERVTFSSSADAIKKNIGMVHQHFMLVEELSVLENIILGDEPGKGSFIDYEASKKKILELMEVNGMQVPLGKKVGDLPVGVQQKVEIIKILFRGADILILDEPTAVLTPQETEELFTNITRLTNQGKTVIFITHKLNEVMQVSNQVAVMRRGCLVATMPTSETNQKSLAEEMVGSELPEMQHRDDKDGVEIIELKEVSLKQRNGIYALKDVNLSLHRGEIVGVAGISGNGQQELADVISGLAIPTEGQVLMHNKDITQHPRKRRIDDGISYIPADRKKEGLCMEWSLAQNSFAGYHTMKKFIKKVAGISFIDTKNVNRLADKMITQFDIRTEGTQTIVNNLSGGNQQKVVIARESIVNSPEFLIAAEPTRGVDIGAISFIHNHMIQMRNEDTGILLISSDLDEIFALSDTIIVLYEGEIVCKFPAKDVTKKELGLYMAGSKVQEVMNHA